MWRASRDAPPSAVDVSMSDEGRIEIVTYSLAEAVRLNPNPKPATGLHARPPMTDPVAFHSVFQFDAPHGTPRRPHPLDTDHR